MSVHRLEIQAAPAVTPFVVLSLVLHIGVGLLITLIIALGLMPEKKIVETKLPAVINRYRARVK